MIRIAVDILSGERDINTYIESSIDALAKHSDISISLVGNREEITKIIENNLPNELKSRVQIENAVDKITMDDIPLQVIRKKKNSSMSVALKLVKQKKVDAFVSSGNTGALLAFSTLIVRTIEGISRPAIFKKLPTTSGFTHMLDLGANVGVKPEVLLEFSVMGSACVQNLYGIENPTIGLLNIGNEESKGSEEVKLAAKLLKSSGLNYLGFIEPDQVYNGEVDVVVCDGFMGNIFLKASEGTVQIIKHFTKQAFTKNLLRKIMAAFLIKDLRSKVNLDEYNGASLLGLQGIVIKSHGSANKASFMKAIEVARLEAMQNISQKISIQVKNILQNQ